MAINYESVFWMPSAQFLSILKSFLYILPKYSIRVSSHIYKILRIILDYLHTPLPASLFPTPHLKPQHNPTANAPFTSLAPLKTLPTNPVPTPQDDFPLPLQTIVTTLHVLSHIFNPLDDDGRVTGYLPCSRARYSE